MDSVPENEWMETQQKANAILSTLKRSLQQTRMKAKRENKLSKLKVKEQD
jgi:hypothetical protein